MNFIYAIAFVSMMPFSASSPAVHTPVKTAPVEEAAPNLNDEREGVIILEGKYQERNIYIANAFGKEGIGYCTYEIRVNGDLITDEINSSAFEIDLSNFELELGDEVIIEIRHKNGCTPKVINPGGLKPKPTFSTEDITISEDGFLEWITTDEYGSLPFIVQQYKWSKWMDVGEVQGKGTAEMNNYAFHVDFVSGTNKFRVIQRDRNGKMKKSPSVETYSEKPQLNYVYNRKSKDIVFSDKTSYELYNKYGEIVFRGFGASVSVASLPKDQYWLSYDSVTEEFINK